MSKARLVITSVTVQKLTVAQVAADYGVARSWIYELLARYRAEGEAAFEPRSRRPGSNPNATSPAQVQLISTIRAQLSSQGLDAGAESIRWHLSQTHRIEISRATIHRILVREGLVVPAPKKRPKSSYVRFAAELPNQCWQADFTHYQLSDSTEVEILCWIDDCTRYALSLTAHTRVTTPAVIAGFQAACDLHGRPTSTLTDNGMVFTTRFSGHPGRNGFEALLVAWHIIQINGRGGHPQTQGKVERFQQTLKNWLRAQPHQPDTLADLQALLDRFAQIYNHERGHRSLPHQAVPAALYDTLPKAAPDTTTETATQERVRDDVVDTGGTVTLRVNGRLHHIGIGRTHARTRVLILAQDLHVRVINATTGEILRELTIDPARDYQPQPPK